MMKVPKIAFFIAGSVPTIEEEEAAEKLDCKTVYVNASLVPKKGNPKKYAGVAGCVPEIYKGLPSAEECLKKFKASKEARKKELKALENKRAAANKKAVKATKEAQEKLKEAEAKEAEAKEAKAQAKASAQKAASEARADKWKPNA